MRRREEVYEVGRGEGCKVKEKERHVTWREVGYEV